MAEKVSKNQRSASSASGASYTELGEMSRVVPLGAGYCYLRSPLDGKTHKTKVNSEQFNELLAGFAAKTGVPRLVAELEALHASYPTHGFDLAAKSLEPANA